MLGVYVLSHPRESTNIGPHQDKSCCGLRAINASVDSARRARRDLMSVRGVYLERLPSGEFARQGKSAE